jgi:hypothetical protein
MEWRGDKKEWRKRGARGVGNGRIKSKITIKIKRTGAEEVSK